MSDNDVMLRDDRVDASVPGSSSGMADIFDVDDVVDITIEIEDDGSQSPRLYERAPTLSPTNLIRRFAELDLRRIIDCPTPPALTRQYTTWWSDIESGGDGGSDSDHDSDDETVVEGWEPPPYFWAFMDDDGDVIL